MEENKNAPNNINPQKESNPQEQKDATSQQPKASDQEQTNANQEQANANQEQANANQEQENKEQNFRLVLSQMSDEEITALIAKAQMADFYLDALQRMKAEYENYQKRIEKERSSQIKYAFQPILNKLISIVDILETAMQTGKQIESSLIDKKFFEGIYMAYKEFFKILQDFGLNKIQSVGAKFNPLYHEAVQQRESKDHQDMTVIEEIQTGYLYQDRLLRASKVIVSKKPALDKQE